MRKANGLILILMWVWLCQCQTAHQKGPIPDGHVVLELELRGKKYEQLTLFTMYPTQKGQTWVTKEFVGSSTDGYNWLFAVPDSVNVRAEAYNIRTQPFNFGKNQDKIIAFTLKADPKARETKSISLEKRITKIQGTYIRNNKKSYPEFGYLVYDTVVDSPTFLFDVFITKLKKDNYTESELSLRYPDFDKLSEDNYEKDLQKHIALVKKYPNSNYLLNGVAYSNGYRNNKDMKLVFDNFSSELKSSDLGQKIERHVLKTIVPEDLDSVQLINSQTGELEPVIVDKSKPTLVVFSASWCAPCHKLIPRLKEIYKDFSPSLDMVYISIDKDSGVDEWNKLMIKEHIPWRSLLAGNKNDGLSLKYAINSVPYSLIIHNGLVKPVDIRDEEALKEHLILKH